MSNPSIVSATIEPVVAISQGRDIMTAIERFDVPSEQRAEAIQKATDRIAQWKADLEFVGAILLRSRDRGGVACYSQWQRPADGASPATPTASRSLAATLPTFQLVDSRTYTVEFTDRADSVALPVQVSIEQTPYAHFGIFSVTREHQDRLLDLARENAPKSLTTPGVVAIDFHRSIDGLQVINLGVWTTFDDFNTLTQQPGFREDNLYWEGVADFSFDCFDVVAVAVG
jgi:quinol monooxygenase YgiN